MTIEVNPVLLGRRTSATLAINERVKALRQAGKTVTHWGFGESPFPVPVLLQDGLCRHADKKAYLPTGGLGLLREAIASFARDYFGTPADASGIFIGPGSKALLYMTMCALDCEVWIPEASWVSYLPQAKMLGKSHRILPTTFDKNHCLQPSVLAEELEKQPAKRPLLILNSPNNPTGAVYPRETLEGLAEVCRRYGVTVLSDEIYALVRFDDEPYHSIAQFYPEGTVVTNGFSKAFSAGGYRLGYGWIPKSMQPLRDALHVLGSETFSAVSSPLQYAAYEFLQDREALEEYIGATNVIHTFSADWHQRHFSEMGLSTTRPGGAFYLLVSFAKYQEALAKRAIQDDSMLATKLLEECRIALLPGSDFYLSKESLTARVTTVDYDGGTLLEKVRCGDSPEGQWFASSSRGFDSLNAWLRSL